MGRRKVWVKVDDASWLAFRAGCVQRSVTVEDELGRLIVAAVPSEGQRAQARLARKQKSRGELGKALDAVFAPPASRVTASSKRRAPAAGTNKRSSRPKRSSSS